MSYNFEQLTRDINSDSDRKPTLYLNNSSWGASAWDLLYNCVLNNDNDISKLIEFINLFQYIMPCKDCCEHFSTYLDKNPIPESREKIFNWLVILENSIATKKYGNDYQQIDRYGQIIKQSKFDYSKNVKKKVEKCKNCKGRVVPANQFGVSRGGFNVKIRRQRSILGRKI